MLPIFTTNPPSKDLIDEVIFDIAAQSNKNIYELTELLMLNVKTALQKRGYFNEAIPKRKNVSQ